MTDGSEMDVKILSNTADAISFERGNKGIPYFIAKNEIAEIKFANGTTETIPTEIVTIDSAKNKIVTLINDYALDHDGTQKLRVTFEGNYLRIIKLDKKANPTDDNLLVDLSKISRFDDVSYRPNNIAFVNVWTMFLKNEKSNQWEKYKLVIRVDDYEKATMLTSAMQQLRRAFKS